VAERVVFDRNRATGGGVTAGIDFALALTAAIRGEDHARFVQLSLEYDPAPPFDSGSPERADAATLERYRAMVEKFAPGRAEKVRRIAESLRG
jgi:cyclohexyl-isocyanide hydratase